MFYDILIKRKLTINTREMNMLGNYISSYQHIKKTMFKYIIIIMIIYILFNVLFVML